MAKLPSYITHWNSFEAPETAWKNGRGKSREIAILPSEADFRENEFLWRLSQAEISQSGEFSSFPGYDRWLSLVEGEGLDLHHGTVNTRLKVGDILRFSGDEASSATLLDGPVQDLGLIFRRGQVQAEMHEIAFLGKARSFALSAKTNFFYAAAGRFRASVYPKEWCIAVEEGDAVRVDREELSESEERLILIEPKDSLSRIVAVELRW